MKILLTVSLLIAVAQAYPGNTIKLTKQSNEDKVLHNVDVNDKVEVDGRIIQGKEAQHGQFPFQTALYFNNGKFCAGSLISTRWVLTTAYCGYNATSVAVHLGAHDLSEINTEEGRVIIHTSEIILYHAYNYSVPHVNNIALINLGEDVRITKYIQAVPLASGSDTFADAAVRMCGWGENSEGGMMSSVLKYVDLVVLSRCDYIIQHDSRICAKGSQNEGFCSKDKGGALIDLYSGKQIGIAGFYSDKGCDANIYSSGFTRITYFTSWITANTGIQI